jgi:hypothetical protein
MMHSVGKFIVPLGLHREDNKSIRIMQPWVSQKVQLALRVRSY